MNAVDYLDYLEGKLPPEGRAEIERHLREHPEDEAELALAREIHAGFASVREEELAPPPDMMQKAEARLRASLAIAEPAPPQPATRSSPSDQPGFFAWLDALWSGAARTWFRPVVGFAALVLLGTLILHGMSSRVTIETTNLATESARITELARQAEGRIERKVAANGGELYVLAIPKNRLAAFREAARRESRGATLQMPPDTASGSSELVEQEVLIRPK